APLANGPRRMERTKLDGSAQSASVRRVGYSYLYENKLITSLVRQVWGVLARVHRSGSCGKRRFDGACAIQSDTELGPKTESSYCKSITYWNQQPEVNRYTPKDGLESVVLSGTSNGHESCVYRNLRTKRYNSGSKQAERGSGLSLF